MSRTCFQMEHCNKKTGDSQHNRHPGLMNQLTQCGGSSSQFTSQTRRKLQCRWNFMKMQYTCNAMPLFYATAVHNTDIYFHETRRRGLKLSCRNGFPTSTSCSCLRWRETPKRSTSTHVGYQAIWSAVRATEQHYFPVVKYKSWNHAPLLPVTRP